MTPRHPSARRAARRASESEPDDAFIARLLHLGKWAEAHQQLLTVLAVVVAILVAGLVYYRGYRESLRMQAAQQLETIHQSFALGDREGARQELVTFVERFAGTPQEKEARLLLGEIYLEEDSPEQAMVVLEPLGARPDEPLELQAAVLLAAAYEEAERWADAERTYLAIADRTELDFQARDALAAAARIREAQGNPQGAIELYQRALQGLEEDAPERGVYEMRIQEIRASTNA
ncbi:MAG TPA: tetratricopeptide repeat protein [Longimicrobiales bacterium]|nr:tetratricopeptide repeat protein [Longimicrobiales bacterium]